MESSTQETSTKREIRPPTLEVFITSKNNITSGTLNWYDSATQPYQFVSLLPHTHTHTHCCSCICSPYHTHTIVERGHVTGLYMVTVDPTDLNILFASPYFLLAKGLGCPCLPKEDTPPHPPPPFPNCQCSSACSSY